MNTVKQVMKPVYLIFGLLILSRVIFRQAFTNEWLQIVWIAAGALLLGMMIMSLVYEKKYSRLIMVGAVLVILVTVAMLWGQ